MMTMKILFPRMNSIMMVTGRRMTNSPMAAMAVRTIAIDTTTTRDCNGAYTSNSKRRWSHYMDHSNQNLNNKRTNDYVRANHDDSITKRFFSAVQMRDHNSVVSPPPTTTPATTTMMTMSTTAANAGPVIRFKNVTFGYHPDTHLLLDNVEFSIDAGSKVTIMGQNGCGKSTITKLITQQIPKSSLTQGQIVVRPNETIGYAMQTMPMHCRTMTIDQFLYYQLTGDTMIPPPPTPPSSYENNEDDDNSESTTIEEEEDIEETTSSSSSSMILPRHEFLSKKGKVLKAVQLHNILSPSNKGGDRIVSTLSGGQQARLLLAAALIQNPSILILDEPTNNMDTNGLEYLQNFIASTEQTCIVISHDEEFLNSFTDMVLYLDIHSKQVESYMGDYYYVKSEISKRIQRENAENARKQQKAIQKKEQANKFANKGGNLRKIAKTMRQVASDMEDSIIDVRREDISLLNFVIPFTPPPEFNGTLMSISHITGYSQSIPLHNGPIQIRKGTKLHLCGPNGIGKSTFLEGIVSRSAPGVVLDNNNSNSSSNSGTRIGYYRQDFYNFDFNKTVVQWLEHVSNHQHTNGELYQIAAKFLLRGTNIMKQPIGTLSEGQKGLLSLACLYITEPAILIVDEPTNHMNFRHLPAIAHALSNFDGALIIVSHDHEFVQQIAPFDHIIDMGKEFQHHANATTTAVADLKQVNVAASV